MAYRVSVCGIPTVDGQDLTVYFTNTESNEKYLKLRVLDTDGNGKGSTTLPNGTQVGISDADKTKGQLVIDIITEKEALDWINSVTDGKVKAPQAYHIYYLENNGNITNAKSISVSMKPTSALKSPVIYSLKTDGSMNILSANVKNGTITFTTDGSPYYVLGEKDSTISTPLPEIINGKRQGIVAGEKKELSFTSNAAFSDFIRVELDGKTLDEKYYTVKEGSTIVTLKADYVATLSVGEHTIGIVSTNGTATTTFTVKAKAVDDTPQTEDDSTQPTQDGSDSMTSPETGNDTNGDINSALWLVLLLSCGGAIIVTGAYSKKKKHSR